MWEMYKTLSVGHNMIILINVRISIHIVICLFTYIYPKCFATPATVPIWGGCFWKVFETSCKVIFQFVSCFQKERFDHKKCDLFRKNTFCFQKIPFVFRKIRFVFKKYNLFSKNKICFQKSTERFPSHTKKGVILGTFLFFFGYFWPQVRDWCDEVRLLRWGGVGVP